MCGIIGYVGPQTVVPLLVSGLYRLEYRGYDSSGVAVLTSSGLRVHRRAGKIKVLEASLPKKMKGNVGIAHTRWATHGAPTDANAHPHLDCKQELAVVHNGIIENATELRAELEARGHKFTSETDTEVLAHLIEDTEGALDARVRAALARVEGTYGIAVIDQKNPSQLVAARRGSPVILGVGEREMFVASDLAALVRHTSQVIHLDDGEVALLEARGFHTTTLDARPTQHEPQLAGVAHQSYERGDFPSFMLKEIHEQPEACARTLKGRLDSEFDTAHLGGLEISARELLDIRRIKLLGCGSAYYAGLAGAHLLEELTRVPADAEPAAEFRYRNPVVERDALYLAVSQSGETFDTLAAVREVRRKGGRVLGVVNAVGSTIARECGGGIYVHAGPEISVTSTKTFTCTVIALALLALHLGRIRDLSPARGRRLIRALSALPERIADVLAQSEKIRAIAEKYAGARSAFFIGRAGAYPIALEGAQKLKEISYIHAEAYPSSELKHGPLALISPELPTIAVVPHDDLLEKAVATLEEIRARSGPIIAVTHAGHARLTELADEVIEVPTVGEGLDPILMAIPLQLFAYHAAVALGRDIDQPRNLAKSVTVE